MRAEGMFVFKACKVQVKCQEDERRKKQLEAKYHNRMRNGTMNRRAVEGSQVNPSVINLAELLRQSQWKWMRNDGCL